LHYFYTKGFYKTELLTMIRSKLIKGLALTSSTVLVLCFLCYRAGLFTNFINPAAHIQTSPNGSTVHSSGIGKAPKPWDSVTRRRTLPSSKSIVIADWKKAPPVNLGKPKFKPGVALTEQQIMSSSKSAILFRPADSTKYRRYHKSKDTSLFK